MMCMQRYDLFSENNFSAEKNEFLYMHTPSPSVHTSGLRRERAHFHEIFLTLQKHKSAPRMNTSHPATRTTALRAAFPYTVPICAGFLFLGMTYGILMNVSGFSFWYPMIMAMSIFSGSVEFVAVNVLLGAFHPVAAFGLAVMIGARHLFYGLSMLDRFRGLGWKKPVIIFMMCDETFSIEYTAEVPAGVDRGWFMLWVSVLDYVYWVAGAVLGAVCGDFICFSTEGLEFVMTAMFVVIFTEQWLKDRNHVPALVGLLVSAACLLVFGAEQFIIPSMMGILLVLGLLRGRLSNAGQKAGAKGGEG